MCLTDDADIAQRLRILRNHGQLTPGVFASASGNYRLSEIAAGMGVVQLGRLDAMLAERRLLAQRYRRALEQQTEVTWQMLPEGAQGNHQTFGVVLPARVQRDEVVARLRERGIEAGRLSYALHTLPQFSASAREAAAARRDFPHATRLAESGLALPLWVGLSENEQAHVIDSLFAVIAS
jgi:perosamine synthetase